VDAGACADEAAARKACSALALRLAPARAVYNGLPEGVRALQSGPVVLSSAGSMDRILHSARSTKF